MCYWSDWQEKNKRSKWNGRTSKSKGWPKLKGATNKRTNLDHWHRQPIWSLRWERAASNGWWSERFEAKSTRLRCGIRSQSTWKEVEPRNACFDICIGCESNSGKKNNEKKTKKKNEKRKLTKTQNSDFKSIIRLGTKFRSKWSVFNVCVCVFWEFNETRTRVFRSQKVMDSLAEAHEANAKNVIAV